ncbi:outer membrane protein assembly factor BamB family protein [Alistipes indistinctus]|uniref:outer membrane protein assembly factor BamB family protein n=1 Tax=Alistipes indistinctus TaxID=626932 RepID=UPI0026DBEB1D|nr:PQQ-binding-like beta-propeller repeat protein [Alistipes indistinctus]
MRRHIILWLLLVPVGLCGQKNTPVTVTCENRFVGRDCVSGDSIPAVLYRFNRRVERISVLDTVAGRAIVQFRDITKNGKYLEPVGPMISMELSDGAVLWQRDIGYIYRDAWVDEKLILETNLEKSRRIDPETGTDLWEKKIRLYALPDDWSGAEPKVGLGYAQSMWTTGKEARGFDLADGSTLWKRPLNFRHRWSVCTMVNDSVVLVQADGLHLFNLYTGQGWDYEAKMNAPYDRRSVLKALGVVPGVFSMDVFNGLASNVILSDSVLYWASREEIAAFDSIDGHVLWKTRLPEKAGSRSNIFETDTSIFVINRGVAVFLNRYIEYGRPFLAAYEKTTGRISMLQVVDQRRCRIMDYAFHEDSVLLAWEDRIAVHDLNSGKLQRETQIDTVAVGRILWEDNGRYCLYDSVKGRFEFVSRGLDDWTLRTDKDNLLRWNILRDEIRTIPVDSCWIQRDRYDNLLLVGLGDKSCLIDDNGYKYAELNLPATRLQGTTMYSYTEEGLVKVDLKPLLDRRYERPAVPQERAAGTALALYGRGRGALCASPNDKM